MPVARRHSTLTPSLHYLLFLAIAQSLCNLDRVLSNWKKTHNNNNKQTKFKNTRNRENLIDVLATKSQSQQSSSCTWVITTWLLRWQVRIHDEEEGERKNIVHHGWPMKLCKWCVNARGVIRIWIKCVEQMLKWIRVPIDESKSGE